MIKFLFIILYSLLAITFIFFINRNNKKMGHVGIYSGFVFGFFLYYSMIPILTLLNLKEITLNYLWIDKFITSKEPFYYFYSIILILLGFIFFHVFYNINFRKGTINKVTIKSFDSDKSIRSFKIIGYFSLVIGGGSLLVLIYALGGVSAALSIAEANRTFGNELSDFVDYRFSLFIVPARLITIAPFIFLYLAYIRKGMSDKLIFLISFILSIIYFLFYAGRAPLLFFLLCFLYIIIRYFTKRIWGKFILIGILLLPLLDILDSLFIYLNTKQWNDIEINYLKYINQFIGPFRNTLNVTDMAEIYGYRYGSDFITAFLNFIPGVSFPISYEVVSEYYSGSNWMYIGGTPSDIITFSYLQFGMFGVIFILSFMGYLFGRIDRALKLFKSNKIKYFLAAVLCVQAMGLVVSADVEAFLRGGVILIFISVVILLSVKKNKGDFYK